MVTSRWSTGEKKIEVLSQCKTVWAEQTGNSRLWDFIWKIKSIKSRFPCVPVSLYPQSESVKWISIVCLRYNFNANIKRALSRELQPVVTLGTLVPAVCGSVFLNKPHSPESQGHRRPIKFRKLALAGVLWLLSSFVLLLLLFCLFLFVCLLVWWWWFWGDYPVNYS